MSLLVLSVASHAQENVNLIGEVQEIARTQGYEAATRRLDHALAQHKSLKPEWLVLKAELKRKNLQNQEAIEIYRKLIRDQPQNLIFRNNLAAVYASQGQLAEAERTLMAGIHSHPELSVLHRNLSALKGRQAALALQQALDPSSTRQANTNLAVLNNINGYDLQIPAHNPTIAQQNTEAPKASIKTDLSQATLQPTLSMPVTPTGPIQPEVDSEQVLSFAQAWASAWSSGDAQRYLTFYSEQFVPESKSSFQAWADQRKQRVTPEQNIQVRIEDAKVLVRTAEDVDIQFRQLYQSKTLKARSNKSLTLSKQTGQWKIVREQIVSR